MISRTNIDLKELKRMGLLGMTGMVVGKIAAYFSRRGRYLLAAKLYHLGTWLYRRDASQLNALLERYFRDEE